MIRKRKDISKRGIILPEVLKLILAVVCLLLLAYLAVSVYGLLTKKTELEQARGSLKQLVARLNTLENGMEVEHLVLVPQNWYIVNYDYEFVKNDPEKDLPKKCYGKSCLCICPGDLLESMKPTRSERGGYPDYFYYRDKDGVLEGLKSCEVSGICQNYNHVEIDKIHFYRVWRTVLLENQAGFVNWIVIPKAVYLKMEDDKITISEYERVKLLKPLLEKDIEFNGTRLSYEEFLLKYLANNCQVKTGGNVFVMSEDAKEKAMSEANNYADQLKREGYIPENHYIEILKIIPDIDYSKLSDALYVDNPPSVEEKRLCVEPFIFSIQIVGWS